MVLREVRRVLKPTGRVLLDLTDGDHMRQRYERRSWEWIDKNYFVCRERSLSDDGARLISREVITHTHKGVVSDQFYGERLYSVDQMRELLAGAGFAEIESCEPFATESRRNQDLGMMGRRILYTARPEKTWTRPKAKRTDLRKVAVMMGDPRRRDAVKPNGNFDDDDFATIGVLKDALANLDGYQATFFDNHDTFIADARRIRTEFDLVFNLCDEGFDNRARWELHVPALLEMLGINYTGGTPQCLAFCFDKSLVRGVAKEMDIPVPDAFVINPDEASFHELTIPFPVIVKPNFGDSSMGITQNSVCSDIRELEAAILEIRDRFGYRQPVLVEQFLTGKDISVGFIGNLPDSLTALPVIEEDYSRLPEDLPKICGYEAKWDPESPYWNLGSIPADLPEATEGFLVASCQRLFDRLECRDYARFDWRLDRNGTPRLLEANPNPGWCWDGHLAKMAKLAGWDYPNMLCRILDAAFQRIQP
jgi:D-alanine-D-alanine ligase